jgi:hypothetical protein
VNLTINNNFLAGGFQCPATDGLYPYPGDCTRYIVCKNGEIESTGVRLSSFHFKIK